VSLEPTTTDGSGDDDSEAVDPETDTYDRYDGDDDDGDEPLPDGKTSGEVLTS